jgi:hypothetical protein
MGTAQAGAAGVIAALLALAGAYYGLLARICRNEQVISEAIIAMHGCLNSGQAPQRAALAAIADTLAAQEEATAQIMAALRARGQRAPGAEVLLRGLLSLPESQLVFAGFLAEQVGGMAGLRSGFGAIAADLLRAATEEVFGDLATRDPAALDRLLLLASGGTTDAVARMALEVRAAPGGGPGPAPRLADLGPELSRGTVRGLVRITRRQVDLAAVLHGQAEEILLVQGRRQRRSGPAEDDRPGPGGSSDLSTDQGLGEEQLNGHHSSGQQNADEQENTDRPESADGQEPGPPGRGKLNLSRRLARHLHDLVQLARTWLPELPRRAVPAAYGTEQLAALAVALDAAGESLDQAQRWLDNGELGHAAQLLAQLRLPVPAGLPGRMYHQESLAAARPLAALGAWHRLAVCRWTADAVAAASEAGPPPAAGAPDPTPAAPDAGRDESREPVSSGSAFRGPGRHARDEKR